jgi:tetratricopeptide (TPR) repeat protein
MNDRRTDNAASARRFASNVASVGVQPALTRLSQDLDAAPVGAWITAAAEVVRLCDPRSARAWVLQALSRWPSAPQLRYWLAHLLWHDNEVEGSERVLEDLLAVEPDHADAVFLLANLWRSQGKLRGAANLLHAWCLRSAGDAQTTLKCAQFIAQCQQHHLALELCEREITRFAGDARVLTLAANLALQLGHFEQARRHALAALDRGVSLNEGFIMQTLAYAQRYRDAHDPDFALFATHLRDPGLNAKARAAILFARAKAFDNIGDYAKATDDLRAAHGLAHKLTPWSGSDWARSIAGEIGAPPARISLPVTHDAVPVFIVGLPRTGTTLVAEQLGRLPQVRNRGELSFLPFIAQTLAASGRADDPAVLREAAGIYWAQLRQDDTPAGFYLDKNPLNFRHLGLVAQLFRNARIIHCVRDRRDTALSLWSQFFAHDDYGFAHSFADIAAFAAGHDRLMQHWRASLPLSIHALDYATLVQEPERVQAELQGFLGIAAEASVQPQAGTQTQAAITTASMWQARQPVYKSSMQRWRAYAPFIPELVELFAQDGG